MIRLRAAIGVVACACLMQAAPLLLADEAAQSDEKPGTAIEERLAEGLTAFNRGDVIGAMQHYRAAADAGSSEAKVRLAWILDQSEDNEGALRLYTEAAAEGNAAGQFGLAEMYANGEGVRRDLRRAVDLFQSAAANGHTQSMAVLAAAYDEGSLSLAPDPERAQYWTDRLAAENNAD
jgi:TPR repeat protein